MAADGILGVYIKLELRACFAWVADLDALRQG